MTLVDANHCPGAVQFLFQLPGGGARYVHCGDMRFSKAQMENCHLQRFVGARAVFLDTTYCHPRHVFPPQVGPTSAGWHAKYLNWIKLPLHPNDREGTRQRGEIRSCH